MFKKQRKFVYLVVLALMILATGGCGKKTEKPVVNNDQQPANQEEAVSPSGEYTINQLLAMKRSMKCSWSEKVTQAGEVTNVIYIDGQKFYQDVAMGDMGHVYTISDGEYLYMWNDFSAQASKMNLKEVQKNAPAATGESAGGNNAGLEQRRDFVCEKWSGDNSIFTPPADKNFQDTTEEVGQAVQELQQNTDKYKQQACDLCAQAPAGEVRDNCLKNAGCN